QSGDILRLDLVTFGAELLHGCVHVDRVPEHDEVGRRQTTGTSIFSAPIVTIETTPCSSRAFPTTGKVFLMAVWCARIGLELCGDCNPLGHHLVDGARQPDVHASSKKPDAGYLRPDNALRPNRPRKPCVGFLFRCYSDPCLGGGGAPAKPKRRRHRVRILFFVEADHRHPTLWERLGVERGKPLDAVAIEASDFGRRERRRLFRHVSCKIEFARAVRGKHFLMQRRKATELLAVDKSSRQRVEGDRARLILELDVVDLKPGEFRRRPDPISSRAPSRGRPTTGSRSRARFERVAELVPPRGRPCGPSLRSPA